MSEKQVMVLPGELIEVQRELTRQHEKWGVQDHADGTGSQDYKDAAVYYRQRCDFRAKQDKVTWADILLEELFEAMAESDEEKLLGELTQVAAVAVQWQLSVRRRQERRAAEYEAQLQTLRDLSVPPVPNPSVSIQGMSQTEAIDSQDLY